MNDFNGRKVLITGASRGIAADIAKSLAERGAFVAVNYCAAADAKMGKQQAAQRLVDEICQAGGKARAIEQDLMVAGAGGQLVARASQEIGPIDTLVLSASIQYHIPFLLQSAEDIADQLRINLQTNIELLQAALPSMARNGYGRILNIGSIQEVSPAAEMPIYALTKAAMKNLIENLAQQCGSAGVVLNNLAPGLIETDRNAFRRENSDEWLAFQKSVNPVGRAGLPSDLTPMALYLLSPENSFTTGATIYATGGSHITNAGMLNQPSLVLPDVNAQL